MNMMTAKQRKSALAESIAHIEMLGEISGASQSALWDACESFSGYCNGESALFEIADKTALDKLSKEYAEHYARGQKRKSGNPVSPVSLGTYASSMKLFADPKVNKVMGSIAAEAKAYVAAVPSQKERANKNAWMLAYSAASLISKGKATKITRELFSGIVAESVERSAKRKTPAVLSDADRRAAAIESFRLACIELQATGLATKATIAALKPVAATLAIDIALPKKAK